MKDFLLNKVKRKPYLCNIVHLNAQSLNDAAHYEEFCFSFMNSGVNIIAVSETFFKPGSKSELLGYNVYRNDRIGKGGGGVAVYVQSNIEVKILSSSPSEHENKPEYIILEVKLQSDKILFACVYRPPKVGYLETFIEDLCTFIPKYKFLVICGDVNARFGSGSGETDNIVALLNSCNATCIPYGTTFHTATCDSTLDIIATNCNDLVVDYDKTPASGFSFHDLLYACINLSSPKSKAKNIYYRDFKNIDEEKLKQDAASLDWQSVFQCDNVDGKVEIFNSILLGLFDKYAPIKCIKVKYKNNPWITDEVIILSKKRDDAWKKYVKSKQPTDREEFRLLRNRCKQEIRNAKLRYCHAAFNPNQSPKEMWSTIRNLGAGKNKCSNSTCTIPPDTLNQYYLSAASITDQQRIDECISEYLSMGEVSHEKFYFKTVMPEDVINAVISITSKAEGVDKVSITMLKLCLTFLIPVLCHIFDFSLLNSTFPQIWKKAQVLPLPKIANPTEPKDYRPVSILCVLAKVFEKIVHKQVCDYLNMFNIIENCQSGFRKGHSTISALIQVTDDVRAAIDNREMTLLILFDFSKAFDRVHHELLLVKMKQLGFSLSALSWFESYLTNRLQQVCLDKNLFSLWSLICTGVPQGSVLGPLLYLLYVNDISKIFKNGKVRLYADDLQYYITFKTGYHNEAVLRAGEDTTNLVKYASYHNLHLNIGKTQPLILGSRRYLNMIDSEHLLKINIEGVTVPYRETVMNLGVVFDQTLTWGPHVDHVCKKVFSIIAQLRRNVYHLPLAVKKQVISSLVFPHIDYGSVIMSDMNAIYKIRMQRLQNACMRYIFELPRDSHITPYYEALSWLKLDQRRILNTALMMWNILRNKTPHHLYEKFVFRSSINSRSGRQSNALLQVPYHRTEKYGKSFLVNACKIWNSLNLYQLINLSYATYKAKVKLML